LKITPAHKEEVKNRQYLYSKISAYAGQHIENVVVPFTDGRKACMYLATLDKTLKQKEKS
jgi:hypothetical protein